MAVDALAGFGHHWWVVSLAIELVRELENVFGTKLYAIAAALAPIIKNMHQPLGDLHLLGVKRNSPICHDMFPLVLEAVGWKNSECVPAVTAGYIPKK